MYVCEHKHSSTGLALCAIVFSLGSPRCTSLTTTSKWHIKHTCMHTLFVRRARCDRAHALALEHTFRNTHTDIFRHCANMPWRFKGLARLMVLSVAMVMVANYGIRWLRPRFTCPHLFLYILAVETMELRCRRCRARNVDRNGACSYT